MAITFNLEINKKKSRKGTYAIFLRITENRKHRKVKTGIELEKLSHWLKSQKISSAEPNYETWNNELKRQKEEADKKYRDLKIEHRATSAKVLTAIKQEEKTFSFIKFVDSYATRTYEAGDYRTYTKYITFLNKLKLCVNDVKPKTIKELPRSGEKLNLCMEKFNKDLLFSEITLSFLNNFKAYLQKIPNSKNPELTLHPNTISKLFDNFASLYRKGIIELEEEGLYIKSNPFTNFSCDTIATNKEKLTAEEISTLQGIELEEDSLLWHCRNYFLFSFYCAGMRAGDLIQLRGTNITSDGRLKYRMDKTSTEKSIKLLPEALDILSYYINIEQRSNKYIFPLLDNNAIFASAITLEEKEQLSYNVKKQLLQQVNSKNSLINKYLNKLAEMAGISKKISMHIARHSFANIARQKDANVYDISKALGHSSIKITESYLSKFDTKSQDETMAKVFNNAQYNQETELMQLIQGMKPEEISSLINQIKR